MFDFDAAEKRWQQLGVNVYDIRIDDAYMRLCAMSDRLETKIVNQQVEIAARDEVIKRLKEQIIQLTNVNC